MRQRRTGRINIERVKLLKVKTGVVFSARPHFIAPANPNKELIKAPGFYLEEKGTCNLYTAYLRGLNSYEWPNDEKYLARKEEWPIYEMIIRKFGGMRQEDSTRIAYLERVLSINDGIYVKLERNSKRPGFLIGNFGDYKAYVYDQNDNLSVNVGEHVLAVVSSVNEFHTKTELFPVQKVDSGTYDFNRGIIIRS